MGSGVLLAALVVLWFVVLVPMVVTRGDAQPGRRRRADSGRTLARRRAVDPVVHAETEKVTVDRDVLRRTGELRVNVHRLRRRALAGLVVLAGLVLVGAVVLQPWLWAPQVFLDLAVVGYLLVLRRAARRERLAARREARAAAREALREAEARRRAAQRRVPTPRPAVHDPVLQETVAQELLPQLPDPSVPIAPVRPLRRGRVVAARQAAPAGWQHSAVVGLDDDDIGFADIEYYEPRAANL